MIRIAEAQTVLKQATSVSPPIIFDWTINVGHVITITAAIIGIILLVNRMRWRMDDLESRLERFEAGLEDFKLDFKELGGQVVNALISIARMEGKKHRPLSEILREEDEHKDRPASHRQYSRKK